MGMDSFLGTIARYAATHEPGRLRRQVICVRPNSFLHDQQFAQGSAVTMATISEAMAAGDTVLIHNMEIYWREVGM